MMKRLLLLFVILFLCLSKLLCFSQLTENNIHLYKKGEIRIYFPLIEETLKPISYSTYLPKRMEIIDGRYLVFLYQPGPGYDYYWIDLETGKYKRITESGYEPGKIFSFLGALTVSNEKEFMICDTSNRVNIFDKYGNFKESILIPDILGPYYVLKEKNNLIISCNKIYLFNLKKMEMKEIFSLTESEESFIKQDTPNISSIRFLSITINEKGNILLTKSFSSVIYEINLNGDIISKIDSKPLNYIDLMKIDPFYKNDPLFIDQWLRTKNEKTHWLYKWSFSGFPDIYNSNYIIVARNIRPPIYLDFYDLKKKTYIGQFNTNGKLFLCSDNKYIYLLSPNRGEKSFIIEKYEAFFNKKKKVESNKKFKIKEITIKDKGKRIIDKKKYITKKEYKETLPVTSIKDLVVKNINGDDEKILDKINKDKKYHFIIIFRVMFECYFYSFYRYINEYCKNNPNYDIYIIANHPFKDELSKSLKLYKYECPFFFNFKPEVFLFLYSNGLKDWYPEATFFIVNNDGTIIDYLKGPGDNIFERLQK